MMPKGRHRMAVENRLLEKQQVTKADLGWGGYTDTQYQAMDEAFCEAMLRSPEGDRFRQEELL